MYKCAMVVTLLYTCTGIEIGTEIGTEIRRYGAEQSRNGKIHSKCLSSGVCWLVGLLWFGSDFFAPIKKFFNFPNFFANYLIFNAFQI